jgi:uracil-DNA glycosylase family 4
MEATVPKARAADPVQKPPVHPVAEAVDKLTALSALRERVEQCNRCGLNASRINLVFGEGGVRSGLMFVGEAPGYHEDQQGLPFVGRAGSLLTGLLEGIGLSRNDVYITNVLKCRPPDNRDPEAGEIECCRKWLDEQIAIIQPQVICSLGNFATKLLSGNQEGISRVHGVAQELPDGYGSNCLFPVFHPAAALYTPSNLDTLKRDFERLPGLLGVKEAPKSADSAGAAGSDPDCDPVSGPEQLDLF